MKIDFAEVQATINMMETSERLFDPLMTNELDVNWSVA